MSDYARLVNEAANALTDLIVRVLDGLVLEPIRAVDDARGVDLCSCGSYPHADYCALTDEEETA